MLDWLFGRSKKEEQPPKKRTPQQERWKYDFLLQFLSGPLWKTSILDFVDYHCVVFDCQEENKFEYTTIHNKFKEMVAGLFDGMMGQVGLDEEGLAVLLQKGFESKHKKVFNQLLLVDDFLHFKKLMVNRNKVLEQQAMKAISQQRQSRVQSRVQTKKSRNQQPRESNQQHLLRQSVRLQQQRLRKMQLEQEQTLRKVMEMSQKEAEEQAMIQRLQNKAAKKQAKQKNSQAQNKKQVAQFAPEQQVKPESEARIPASKPALPPVNVTSNLTSTNAGSKEESLPAVRATRRRKQPKVESPDVIKQESSPQVQKRVEQKPIQTKQQAPAQIKQEKPIEQSHQDRKQRLKQQRQKLRKIKEQQRRKQMAQQQSKPVHTIVLQDDGIHETQLGVEQQKKVSSQQIERRKALMKRIKNRIVDDF